MREYGRMQRRMPYGSERKAIAEGHIGTIRPARLSNNFGTTMDP